jgi:quercetin dioxygenase-like cupin family protein
MAVLLWSAAALAGGAVAQADVPQPIDPEQLKWLSPPNNPLLRAAWVLGSEKEHGTYVLRVRLAKDGRIPAHTHPDTRYSTVLSGTLYVGFGATPDESRMVAVPAGAVYVVPANVPHYLWARDGEVTYQEAGTGPTATTPVTRAAR